jgi:hypothetical protein
LLGFQRGACSGDVRTILLGGVQSFFEGNIVTLVEAPDRAYCGFILFLERIRARISWSVMDRRRRQNGPWDRTDIYCSGVHVSIHDRS